MIGNRIGYPNTGAYRPQCSFHTLAFLKNISIELTDQSSAHKSVSLNKLSALITHSPRIGHYIVNYYDAVVRLLGHIWCDWPLTWLFFRSFGIFQPASPVEQIAVEVSTSRHTSASKDVDNTRNSVQQNHFVGGEVEHGAEMNGMAAEEKSSPVSERFTQPTLRAGVIRRDEKKSPVSSVNSDRAYSLNSAERDTISAYGSTPPPGSSGRRSQVCAGVYT